MNDVWLKELAEEQTKRLLEYYIKLRKQHKLSQSELERINRSIADFDQPI